IQNLKQLMLPDRLQRLDKHEDREYNPLIGLEVFYPIAQAFAMGRGPTPLESIAAQASIPIALARDVLDALREQKLVLRVNVSNDEGPPNAYLPARPLDDIPVMELILACRSHMEETAEQRTEPFIASLRKLHLAKEEELFQGMTAAVLAQPSETDKVRLFARSITGQLNRKKSGLSQDNPLSSTVGRAQHTLDRLRQGLKAQSHPPTTGTSQPPNAQPQQAADPSQPVQKPSADDDPIAALTERLRPSGGTRSEDPPHEPRPEANP
ncbi:MAG: hypothetical protein AAFS10_11030, partial [Myxococcota bacterium]